MSKITSNQDGTLTKLPGADPSSIDALIREITAMSEIKERAPNARIPVITSSQIENATFARLLDANHYYYPDKYQLEKCMCVFFFVLLLI